METKGIKGGVRLTYVYHDCFVLETPSAVYVFDYWKCPGVSDGDMPSFPGMGEIKDKKVYVVVSHHHKDHFVKDIFRWKDVLQDVHYILSKDVYRSVRYALREGSAYRGAKLTPDDYTVLRPGEDFERDGVVISAFGSTDTGNSYVVSDSGFHIFHAGDLNAWVWKDESTEKEVRASIRDFEGIVRTIGERYPVLDLAMFPVDSRIGRDYWEGAGRFVRILDVKRFVPMHFELAEDEEVRRLRHRDALDFSLYRNPERGEYIGLSSSGDSLEFV